VGARAAGAASIIFWGVIFGTADNLVAGSLKHITEWQPSGVAECIDERNGSIIEQSLIPVGSCNKSTWTRSKLKRCIHSRTDICEWTGLAKLAATVVEAFREEAVCFAKLANATKLNLICRGRPGVLDGKQYSSLDIAGFWSTENTISFGASNAIGIQNSETKICPQLPSSSVGSGLIRLLSGLGSLSGCVGGFFGLNQSIFQGVVRDQQDHGIDDCCDHQRSRPNHQPSREAVNWVWLIEPPQTFWWAAIAGLATGFILLFGPHNRPQTDRRANAGACLFLGGLAAFAAGGLTAVALS
jgi:hypothetical protein